MLFDPRAEELEYDRSLSEAHQESLSRDSDLCTKNDSGTVEKALEDPAAPQNRPSFR